MSSFEHAPDALATPAYTKHLVGNQKLPEYWAWHAAKQRCLNKNNPSYAKYGGRGIKFFDGWLKFEAFYAAVGPRPSDKHSIDRYPNNDGNYEPGNVRWAIPVQQIRNRRVTITMTMDGETLPLAEWAERVGISWLLLSNRKRTGWSDEEALTTPVNLSRSHHTSRPYRGRRRGPKSVVAAGGGRL